MTSRTCVDSWGSAVKIISRIREAVDWKKRQSNHLVDRPMGKQQLQVELTLFPKRLASGSILHDIAPLQQKTQGNERKVRNEGSRCIVGHSS